MGIKDQLVAQVSQELLDELTDNGTRDLTEVRLSQMEAEVYQAADRISQRVLRGILEDQSGQAQADCCPCCHSPLEDRPPDEKPIKMQRCEVQWCKPVKRCLKCRRDFFPSGGDVGLFGGSDV
jgi:hypothetical protein